MKNLTKSCLNISSNKDKETPFVFGFQFNLLDSMIGFIYKYNSLNVTIMPKP